MMDLIGRNKQEKCVFACVCVCVCVCVFVCVCAGFLYSCVAGYWSVINWG